MADNCVNLVTVGRLWVPSRRNPERLPLPNNCLHFLGLAQLLFKPGFIRNRLLALRNVAHDRDNGVLSECHQTAFEGSLFASNG